MAKQVLFATALVLAPLALIGIGVHVVTEGDLGAAFLIPTIMFQLVACKRAAS